MSRKARLISEVPVEDNVSPKIWLANKGYSEYKPDIKTGRTKDAVVILYHRAYESDLLNGQHTLVTIGGIMGRLLSQTESLNIKNIVSVDISSLVSLDKYEELMDEEGASINLEKKLSKPVCRVLEKMFLQKATIVAFGAACQLLLKVIPVTTTASDAGHRLTSENVSRLVFINPSLSTRCINSQFRGTPSTFATMAHADIYFSSQSESDRRLPIIRSFFQNGRSCIRVSQGFPDSMLSALSTANVAGGQLDDALISVGTILLDDLDATNTIGETIWMSEVTITMNRNSKQYEQFATDMTRDMRDLYLSCKKKNKAAARAIAQPKEEPKTSNGGSTFAAVESGNKGSRIGGLVLRGNRCVLVRSLKGHWDGMCIPSVNAATDETPQQTAARAVTELCDIDGDEFYILSGIEPLTIYQPYGQKEGNITVYLMYAEQPPPDGPLEDQDTEDVTDLYDWYTWHRAVKALSDTGNESSIAVMRSIASVLAAASASASAAGDLIPRKWGGVFGQEWMSSILTGSYDIMSIGPPSNMKGEERRGLVKPSSILNVLIVVGAFGSGKTSLLQSILANQGTCQRIAVIVNSLSSLNFDGTLLQESGEKDDDENDCSTFKLFEINESCMCCSGHVRLLAELQEVADSGEYDYCIIEASATADLFTLKKLLSNVQKNTGWGSFLIDNTVAVVDAATCLQAATSRSISKKESSQLDAIENIMYRQVRAADIILINKIDLIHGEQKSSSSSSSSNASRSSSTEKASAKMDIIRGALRLLSSDAVFMESSYGDVDPSALLYTRRAQLKRADQSDQLNVRVADSGVSTWIFRSLRPFHPSRLDTAMRELRKSDPHNSSILRMNGYTWLANYPDNQGLLSYTNGHEYSTKLGSPWWASMPKAKWPKGLEDAIRPLWREPYGDRQIEVVITGLFNDTNIRQKVEEIFMACLLNDDEFALGQPAWNELDDPFSFTWS